MVISETILLQASMMGDVAFFILIVLLLIVSMPLLVVLVLTMATFITRFFQKIDETRTHTLVNDTTTGKLPLLFIISLGISILIILFAGWFIIQLLIE